MDGRTYSRLNQGSKVGLRIHASAEKLVQSGIIGSGESLHVLLCLFGIGKELPCNSVNYKVQSRLDQTLILIDHSALQGSGNFTTCFRRRQLYVIMLAGIDECPER